jgi:hypothetical protein
MPGSEILDQERDDGVVLCSVIVSAHDNKIVLMVQSALG